MFAVVGANGNVGYSTARALREAGVEVRAIVHDASKATRLSDIGCKLIEADLQDSASLVKALDGVEAAQLVLPLRPQTPDPVADMQRSAVSLLEALHRTRLDKALFISDYGAHVSWDIGMPSLFRDFEREFKRIDGPKIILRSAEYMHNWARLIPAALSSGSLPSFQDPTAMVQPTIAAPDLGLISSRFLLHDGFMEALQIVHAEGPRRYSADEVAQAVGRISGRVIAAKAIDRMEWSSAMSKMPPSLAELMTKTNEAKNRGGLIDVEPGTGEVVRGPTDLISGLGPLVLAK